MAKTIQRITIDTPENLQAQLQAGGNLTPETTYYYRVIAFRRYNNCNIFSQPSAEVSVTPNADNKTVLLTWDAVAGATAYALQRTTTSGSYPPAGSNTFTLQGRPYSPDPYVTTLLTLTDNGLASGRVAFNGCNLDFSREIPCIEVSSDTAEVITLADILAADLANGWEDIRLIGSEGFKTADATNWRAYGPYLMLGNIYARDCTFRLYGMLITFQGTLYCDVNTAILEAGHKTSTIFPYLFWHHLLGVWGTNDNDSHATSYSYNQSLSGKTNSFARLLVRRPLSGITVIGDRFNSSVWDDGPKANVEVYDSILGVHASNAMPFNPTVASNNIFESIRPYVNIEKANIRFGALSYRWVYNITVKEARTRNVTSADMEFGPGGHAIDCIWEGSGQTDNQPRYSWWMRDIFLNYTFLHSFSLRIRVSDNQDNPLAGAAVTLIDALGNSDIWQASGATFSTALNNTDETSTLTVSNGALFQVNDIIRLENSAELLKVESINGNNLTVLRGWGGTGKRKNYTGGSNRVLKQVASLVTDDNGLLTSPEAVLNRELVSILGDGSWPTDWENNLVAAGKVERNYRTPHTLTIAMPGYQTYKDVIEIDRKMDLEVSLLPGGAIKPMTEHCHAVC